ncbi:MAG: 16S rRNA (uracil(1498)-N(3))-methyltransferase [Chitinophagaceae bacterium]
MTPPFFYVDNLEKNSIVLDEGASKHISVLRLQKGMQILLTDGKGKKAIAKIVDDNRKKSKVEISSIQIEGERNRKIVIGISLIKNLSRFEWFLEKATEIGVSEIIPLICKHTEKQSFKFERMNAILISAKLQSQQCWLPVLHAPTQFNKAVMLLFDKKFIAHCNGDNKKSLTSHHINLSPNQLILIGPEGDFTKEEIDLALQNSFTPVSLGNTRLRTETAGIVAAAFLCN